MMACHSHRLLGTNCHPPIAKINVITYSSVAMKICLPLLSTFHFDLPMSVLHEAKRNRLREFVCVCG